MGVKESLSDQNSFFQNEKQIVIYLFAVSAVLILLVLALLYLFTSQYRHAMSLIGKMTEVKRSRLNYMVTIGITLALMVFAVVYNNVILYNASVVSIYEEGDEAIKTTATELENYLTVAVTTLRVAADSVDLMVDNGSSTQEIANYIVDQTSKQSEQFDENFTGLYACINGEYLDGLNWVPPEGYDPTARDWYKTATEADGEIVIVSPYQDAQTGSIVITIGKEISKSNRTGNNRSQNVVCLDVIVNYIQEVTQSEDVAGKGFGFVVNSDGFIIAHRESDYNGENLAELYGKELLDSILNAKDGRIAATIKGEEYTLFLSPVMDQWYAVIAIDNTELLEDTRSQLAVNIMVSLITFILISFFYYIGYMNEQISGKKVEEMNIQVVTALAAAIDAKDNYTNGHSSRVAEYAKMIAARSGYSQPEQDEIYLMGLLHDVGKIGVPDEVINKPSKLTEEEFELIKKHPVIGNSILSSIKESPKLATGARWHHERYGGGGYPDGISGEQIPEEARIIAVADAYDAMTSRRSYRQVMPQNRVRSEIEKGMNTQFDPRFARIMLQMIDEDTEYSMREK
jgi:HD-GYP domain-containing protein (c-di-GMP phosphodiesterase class II)